MEAEETVSLLPDIQPNRDTKHMTYEAHPLTSVNTRYTKCLAVEWELQ